MGKLHDLITFPSDNRNKTGARRQYRFFRIQWPQTFVERGSRLGIDSVELKCKNLRKLLNAKWANGHREALE
jgi:hypothetical protein